jgi:hypothetical protein
MRKSQNSLYAPDWIKAARKDWRRMETMLGVKDAEAKGLIEALSARDS